MMKVEMYEGTNGDPLKIISFLNTKGWVIRESYFNPFNQPVLEEMVEIDDKMKIFRYVLFDQNYNIIAYCNLYQALENQREDKRSGSTDYRFIDGAFKKISWTIYQPSCTEKLFSKNLYYDQNDEMLYYCINDDTTLKTTYFYKNDQVIGDMYAFYEAKIDVAETYDTIKRDLLQQAREKYSDKQE